MEGLLDREPWQGRMKLLWCDTEKGGQRRKGEDSQWREVFILRYREGVQETED